MSSTSQHILEIKDLHVAVEGQAILRGVTLTVKSGEMHAIMGPNGSGKSTLCYALMGHPKYEITGGKVLFDSQDITQMPADQRAHLGLFLGFQYPREVPGVTFGNFMRTAVNAVEKARDAQAKPVGVVPFYQVMERETGSLKMDKKFIARSLNEGFSGGEKKRAEIVQMAVLKPRIAMLDEIDSGLDIDALKIVAGGIEKVRKESGTGVLLITHYQRILDHVRPDFVHVMASGKIVKSGGFEVVELLEKEGYEKLVGA